MIDGPLFVPALVVVVVARHALHNGQVQRGAAQPRLDSLAPSLTVVPFLPVPFLTAWLPGLHGFFVVTIFVSLGSQIFVFISQAPSSLSLTAPDQFYPLYCAQQRAGVPAAVDSLPSELDIVQETEHYCVLHKTIGWKVNQKGDQSAVCEEGDATGDAASVGNLILLSVRVLLVVHCPALLWGSAGPPRCSLSSMPRARCLVFFWHRHCGK